MSQTCRTVDRLTVDGFADAVNNDPRTNDVLRVAFIPDDRVSLAERIVPAAAREHARPERWSRKAILNVAHMGKLSSDRSIEEYARKLWDLEPCLEAVGAR